MKSILLIGLGKVGLMIAKNLNELKQQVMAVDVDEERVNSVMSFVTNAQIGDSTNEEFLNSLGIPNFDVCIVAIGDDFQSSLETTSLLKDLGAKKVISRASTDIQEKFLLRNGADEVIYPEKQLATWTSIRCMSEHVLDYIELDKNWSIYEISVPKDWNNKTVLQLDLRKKFGINILGVRENQELNMNVTPETKLMYGTSILVLGEDKTVQKCFHI